MSLEPNSDWRLTAGLNRSRHPGLFLSPADVTPDAPQAHAIRHAFQLLDLDGVFCTDGAPIVFFKRIEGLAVDEVAAAHKAFWNHGGAPILVLISGNHAQIHSGMSRPVQRDEPGQTLPTLVETLDHLATTLPEFLLAVETGAFFREHARSFDASKRVDRDLLVNLSAVRIQLAGVGPHPIPIDVLDALLCRLVFTCYLFDRGVVGQQYLKDLGLGPARHLRDVLGQRPLALAKSGLTKIFRQLSLDFNGDLFSDDVEAEAGLISDDHVAILDAFFRGTQVSTGQMSFWPYDFQYIPIETISAIYEHFLKAADHDDGAFYTPRFLAEIVLDAALEGVGTRRIEPMVDAYFGVQAAERLMIDDAVQIIIPSIQPTRTKADVPTLRPAQDEELSHYAERLSATLSMWSRQGASVTGRVIRSRKLGLAMAIVERTDQAGRHPVHGATAELDILQALDRLQNALPGTKRALDFARCVTVFDGPVLYVVKPDTHRNWMQSAALNDADEIAGLLLTSPTAALT